MYSLVDSSLWLPSTNQFSLQINILIMFPDCKKGLFDSVCEIMLYLPYCLILQDYIFSFKAILNENFKVKGEI